MRKMLNTEEIIRQSYPLRLLLVEDNPVTRDSMVMLLEVFFSTIIVAVDGEDGLEKFKNNEIDIVITDIDMPIIDGLTMAEQIKDIDKNVSILLLSAYREPKYFIQSIQLGIDGYLLKPFNIEMFLNVLKNILGKIGLQKEFKKNLILKERLELALKGYNAGAYEWNMLDNSAYYSPQWYKMLGYEDNELPSHLSTWSARVHPDDLDTIMLNVQKTVDAKITTIETVHRLQHKDGQWLWILGRGIIQYNENSQAFRMVGIHTNITEKKAIEERALERGKILDNSLNEIYIFDANDYHFLYINEEAKKNIGYNFQEISKLTPLDCKPNINKEEFLKNLKPLLENTSENISFSTQHQRKDKTLYDVDVYLQKSFFEGNDAYVAIIIDTTKRKKAELSLKKQHSYLQTIIDSVYDPIMVIKEDYTVELMNSTIKEKIQYLDIANPEHPKCYEVSHNRSTPCDGDTHPCPLKDVLDSKKYTKVIHEHHNENGAKHYVELSATPLLDEDKNCIGIIESSHDITEHLEFQKSLIEQKSISDYQAHHDFLTGLPNRILFNDRLEQGIKKAKRHKKFLALFFIDLDHFKEINDSLGHKTGDEVLKVIAQRLKDVMRDEDTITRLGGDEFTIIMENFTQIKDASFLANKILTTLKKIIYIEDNKLQISASIGISISPNDGDTIQSLLKYADSAMYKAKKEGRDNYQFYSS